MLDIIGPAWLRQSLNTGIVMAGVAIAVGFGMVMGILFIVRGDTGPGLAILGLTIFIGAAILSPSASIRFLITSIAAIVCSGALAYSATRSEVTGKTVEYHSYGRVLAARPVIRQDTPEKFRRCTNWRWALSVGFLGGSALSFGFYRKSDSADWLS